MEKKQKPFSYEDWMNIRKSQVKDFLSKNRKIYGTFNELLEDPEIWKKVNEAAKKDPSFARMFKNIEALNDPASTQKFINKLNQIMPNTRAKNWEELKKAADYRKAHPILSKIKDIAAPVEAAADKYIGPITKPASEMVEKGIKFGEEAAEKAAAWKPTSLLGKGTKFVGSTVGKYASPAFAGYEAYKTLEEIEKGRPYNALAHGLQAAGGGLMMIPHPYAKGAGLVAGLTGLGMQIGGDEEPENPEISNEPDFKTRELLKKNEENAKRIEGTLANEYEDDTFSPEPSPTPSASPQAEPSPTPKEDDITLTGGFKNTLMDILGMPSASAEEMPKTPPAGVQPQMPLEGPQSSTMPDFGVQPPVPSPAVKAPMPVAKALPKPSATPVIASAQTPSPSPSVAQQAPVAEAAPVIEPAAPEQAKKKKDKAYYKNYIMASALRMGVNPALPLSVLPVESGGRITDTKLTSNKGAIGPLQVMPGTVADLVDRADKLQGYETPEIKNEVMKVVSNLKNKINFAPYQRLFNEVAALRRKGAADPAKETALKLLTNDIANRLKELKPEDHINISNAIFKMKASDLKLDALNPEKQTRFELPGTKIPETHGQRLIRGYNGGGAETYDYLAKVNPYLEKNLKGIKEFEESGMAVPFSQETEEEAVPNPNEVGKPGSITLDKIDETTDLDEGDEGLYPADILDILKQSKKEDESRRMRDLMVLKNYLQGGAMAQMGKGLQLAASGIVGAGPKKKFVTVPELKGMETWDTLAKEGEKGIVASELMSKFAEKSPTSLKSKRMQNTFISALKRWYPDKELSQKDIDIIKSMSAEEIEKQLETEKGMAKYESSIFGKNIDRQFKVQKQAQARTKAVLEPIIQRLAGTKTLDDTLTQVERGELTDTTSIARQINTDLAALLLPPGTKLGVTGQEAAQISNLGSQITKLQNWVFNTVKPGALPEAYLPTIRRELDIFRERYKELLKHSSEGLKKEFYGLPEQYHAISDAAIDARTQAAYADAEPAVSKKGFNVGDVVEMNNGEKFKKIKPGDDMDKSNWELVK